jgi:hypothetical protein
MARDDHTMRETVTALLEGVSVVWLMIFSTSMAGLETVLDLPPPPTAQVELGVWSYAMAALLFTWLSWVLLIKLLRPASVILNRRDLGDSRIRLIRTALIRAARPSAVVAFVLFIACHVPQGTMQFSAMFGVLVVMRWFAKNRPNVAQRLIDHIMPQTDQLVQERPVLVRTD